MLHKPLFLLCAGLAAPLAPLLAAELGDIAPHSYIGQPLSAEIELVSLTPEEAAQGLQVRLAVPDVYRGANVTMNPALTTVRMAVVRRGTRQFLQVSTTRPVDADYVHLYVELGVPGKQDVRLATVWLQRDPNPAPPPVPAAAAMTAAQAEQIAAEARAARLAADKASAPASSAATSGARPAVGAARERGRPAPLPSMHEAETGQPGEIKAAGQERRATEAVASAGGAAPGMAGTSAAAAPPAAGETERVERIAGVRVSANGTPLKPSASEPAADSNVPTNIAQALLPLHPLPLPKGVKRPAPASCAPSGMPARECVALDHHNAELSSKLNELEGKLKALQGALGGAAAKAAMPAGADTRGGVQKSQGGQHADAAAASPAPKAGAASAKLAAQGGEEAHAAKAGAGAADATGGSSGHAGKAVADGGADHAATAGADGKGATHAAKGSADSDGANHAGKDGASAAQAAASAASSAPAVPQKQIRVLPKLKYKKEKPPEEPSSMLPLAAGGIGVLALAGAGWLWWRKKKLAGKGPLKIWQGFRKKKAPEPAALEPEPTPESVMQ